MEFWKKKKSEPLPPEQPAEVPQPSAAELKRKFPTVGDVLAMLGITFGAQILLGVVGMLCLLASGHTLDLQSMEPHRLAKYLFALYLLSMGTALVGVWIYRRSRGGRDRWLYLSPRGLNPIVLIWAFVLMLSVSVVIEPIVSLLPDVDQNLGRGVWLFVTVVLCAPLLEELLCRGLLLESLRSKYGVVVAWLLSSLFFGVLHMQPAQVITATVLGLVLGYVYIATNSLWASIILHAANNLVAFLLLQAGHENTMVIDLVGSKTGYVLIYIVALAVSVLSGVMMLRKLRHLKEEQKNRAAE